MGRVDGVMLLTRSVVLPILNLIATIYLFLSSFWFFQGTVRTGLDEEGRRAVSVLFVFCLKTLFLFFK